MNIGLNSCLSLMHSLKKNCLVESPRRTQSTAAHYQHIIGPPLPSAVSLHTNVRLKNKGRQNYISAILPRTDKTNTNLPCTLGSLHLTLQLFIIFFNRNYYLLFTQCLCYLKLPTQRFLSTLCCVVNTQRLLVPNNVWPQSVVLVSATVGLPKSQSNRYVSTLKCWVVG